VLTESAARWVLVLHTIVGVAAVGAATHLVLWLRKYLRGQSGKRRAVVRFAWLVLALRSGYHEVVPRVEEVLGAVGRMKFLRPLYTALAADERTRPVAVKAFERLRAGYHPIARQVVESVLRQAT